MQWLTWAMRMRAASNSRRVSVECSYTAAENLAAGTPILGTASPHTQVTGSRSAGSSTRRVMPRR